ncbi:Uncharacterised protein [Actinomyces bovis]|uniref:Uncharacterized protein n=1 Tax=Actinomyces bovis TaxID=1658 RepID=A0ABY1VKE3_9ACTO|nr:hypothetical protein [Actinomyces bovis]SPT52555.1 Uncharacterised protein [Actinomyces bovis]VEG54324.1 Uncharacterised protein [Actinomyces israelii]
MRDAERVAEREAYLTGQQPLLTRREMKRLREESEALQAAIDSGEITLEQAKALQNPLAEQPDIDVPVLHATGSHAALSEEMLAKLDAEASEKAKEEAADKPEDDASDSAEAAEPAEGQAENSAGGEEQAEAAAESADEAVEGPELAAADKDQNADEQVSGEASEADEAEKSAEDDDSDNPAEDQEQEPAASAEEADQVASSKDADEDSEQPKDADDSASADGDDEAERKAAEEKAAAEKAEAERKAAEEKAAAEKAEAERKAAEEKAAAEKAEAERKAAEEKAAAEKAEAEGSSPEDDKKVPKRRPIVRVPGVAQGVRSVNQDTGELEAIKPVEGEDYEPGEAPHWKSLRRADFKVRDGGFAVEDEGPKLAPTASSADQPDEVPEMKPDLSGQKPSGMADDADQRTWQDITAIPGLQEELNKDSGSSEMMRYLLLGLLALVIVLVVGALVWAFIAKSSDSAALVTQWAPLLV